ncbi:hypothetical protein FDZ64_01375 [Ehrlichia ruminantium]|uniref:hypothetical protein n=1 Tax=Ehrlichia ruminantium TaxID=779 RepID=UPI0015DBFEAB|nr:hypothetical protein [Ehrlichia ruminantium]QLK53084.1 hypothetical protein FDZ64_01375 [Ehrlichia ruminantium]
MLIINEYVRKKLIPYKSYIGLFPEANKVNSSLWLFQRRQNILLDMSYGIYSFAIDYVDYVFKKRSKKDQIICAIKTNIHIFISNTLFFMMIYLLIHSKILGVFIKNNTNIVLDAFLTSVLLSSISVILGCIVHAIVLKAEGKPISDFASTGELEDKLLCTDFFICLSAISLRIYKLLCDFVSKFIFNTSKVKNSVYLERSCHTMLYLRYVCTSLYNNIVLLTKFCADKDSLPLSVRSYFESCIDDVKHIQEQLNSRCEKFSYLVDVCQRNPDLYVGEELYYMLNQIEYDIRNNEFSSLCICIKNMMEALPDNLTLQKILLDIQYITCDLGYKVQECIYEPRVEQVKSSSDKCVCQSIS